MNADVTQAQKAANFITSSCKTVGAFLGTSDVPRYVNETASNMAGSDPNNVFPDRYIEHVAYALHMVGMNFFTSPPAAIASVYLVTRFEYYFRILSGKLNGNGTWVSTSAQSDARSAIDDDRLRRKRVNSVSLTYKIMMLDRSHRFVQHCAALDDTLYSTPTEAVGSTTIADIGDRIEFGRNVVSHGHWGDISAEALFYALLTSLVFHCENEELDWHR